MPYSRKLVEDPTTPDSAISREGLVSIAIGGIAAIIALAFGANTSEMLLTYIAAGGSALAAMPYRRN